MMKPRSKSVIFQAVLLSLCFASPDFVYAEAATSGARGMQTSFCASLDLATQKIARNILEKEDKYASKEKVRGTRLEEKMNARDRATQSARLDTDATHDKVFAKLIKHAKTDTEKVAIEKFKQGLDMAISARRASVDAAVSTFNRESAKFSILRQHDVDNATTTLRNATIKAGSVAKIDCKNGLPGTTVRARYIRDLKNARMQLEVDVSSALKRNENISVLIKNRDADIKKAVNVFKAALAALRLDLESTLKAN